MSETTDLVDAPSNEVAADTGAASRSRRRGSGLSGMLLPELQRLAGELGIAGTGKMRKSDLVAAISERQVGGPSGPAPAQVTAPTPPAPRSDRAADSPVTGGVTTTAAPLEAPISGGGNGGPVNGSVNGAAAGGADTAADAPAEAPTGRRRRTASRPAGAPMADADNGSTDSPGAAAPAAGAETRTESPPDTAPAEGHTEGERPERPQRTRGNRDRVERDGARDGAGREGVAAEDRTREGAKRDERPRADGNHDSEERAGRNRTGGGDGETGDRAERGRSGRNNRDGNRDGGRPDGNRNDVGRSDVGRSDGGRNDAGRPDEDDDEFDGNGRRRGRRYRDRNRRGGNAGGGGRERFEPSEPTVSDDDVLLPVAGILDVLDSYAFVRTSGYLTGPNDVYVSLSQVRRHGLRRGDAITGAVRQPREGERKDKYNALVRLDSVNGLDPEQARDRPEFTKLTPLYPQERLRLETESNLLTTRLMDLVMPIGKGQRALIVSPPKAGKTMVLQAIANAISTNNPECHLMVVLVDERPEEVTDMQRSVKGEVIASTFDRPPSDHTTVAELSIERAKRLVEMGHDVVVLLDSITRLGRAYNLAAPASGRILSGGVDSTALYPPKRFLGAARNIENGGSLTIIASALVETGSTMDTVIFEEFKGTGNAEIKLDRRLADKRVFPAVDVNASGTRKEEILLAPDELAIIIKLRRVLSALEPQQAIELLLDRMRKTRNNIEFLMQVQKTTLGVGEKD
ncbi:transcription termination factor Rho [Modestobacter sp. DSM 44400]|uniref:transcription termination factor Rho n=1 Tax=Modestobacter sp. DSM 44400 TaxID=1550230 RepID=UPI00089C22C5|nr:transcription termination factor Rho [Modestobacter sp. DSM 44400]SDX65131.1 transcription termination factor Rho [Modestobacter sp. DSM 44400]